MADLFRKFKHIGIARPASIVTAMLLLVAACGGEAPAPDDPAANLTTLKRFRVDSLEHVIDRDLVTLDAASIDGGASLSITSTGPTLDVRLFEISDLLVKAQEAHYLAFVAAKEGVVKVQLRAFYTLPPRNMVAYGSSKAPDRGWTLYRTAFDVYSWEEVSRVSLGVRLVGAGTVRIDDIRLAVENLVLP